MRRTFRRICVYCGSSQQTPEHYLQTARDAGRHLAEQGIGVVYGGGNVGLMGALADAALAAEGEVIGVIPEKLRDLEVAHTGISELHVTSTMHDRKMKMATLADGFVALPGGWGTLEEIFEVTTWTQLRYHDKPVGMLNAHRYYDHLVAFLAHAKEEGFIRSQHSHLICVGDDLDEVLEAMATCELPELDGKALRGV
jgi:uncharacterized protein (TIGR00730 family)